MKPSVAKTLSFIFLLTNIVSGVAFAGTVQNAKKAMNGGQYEYAYAQWKKVLDRNPRNLEALEAMDRLQRIARNLFEEALMCRVSEERRAKDLLRSVVLLSDPWSELNREACTLLGEDL